MRGIEVVRVDRRPSPEDQAFARQAAFETDTLRVGTTRIRPGGRSAWHHHGRRLIHGYVAVGEFVVEFGPRGSESVRVSEGEFFRVQPGWVHRDVNDTSSEVLIVMYNAGEGPPTVDVAGPDE
jgi:quercetin dioxygenase-like cupin family protein